MPLQLLVMAVAVMANYCQVDAMPTTRAARTVDPAAASTLFACGDSGDVAAGSKQIIDLFAATKSVCCDELQEQCDASKPLPDTCGEIECARVVDIVAQSCEPTFAADGFFRTAFKSSLDPVVAKCSAQQTRADYTPTYVITDPKLHNAPITTCHGRLVDSATSGFTPSVTGLDAVVLQAPQGMQLQVSVGAMYLPPTANIRIYDGQDHTAVELGILRGTKLDAREFVSTTGVLRVLRAVDFDNDGGRPMIFGLNIGCACKETNNCGKHGSCISGMCHCDNGYSGAMCDEVIDPCATIDCGEHGECVEGVCRCSERYSGPTCQIAPLQCRTTKHGNVVYTLLLCVYAALGWSALAARCAFALCAVGSVHASDNV